MFNRKEAERLTALRECCERYEDEALSPDDEAMVRACLDDESESVRLLAMDILLDQGPLTWDDVEGWLMSPVDLVRERTVTSVSLTDTTALGRLCESDKNRCANLLAESWKHHPDDTTSVDISMLALNEEGWLDPTWRAMERLFDQGDDHIKGNLTYGYFENTIAHFKMSPEDPHIGPWIAGIDASKKWALLEIGRWLGMGEEFLVDIAASLAEDSDSEIADAAKELLSL